ncbi:MAG: hypothetical protein ACLFP1_04755 [Candidatus Goldiibacteriota bacterium]
MDENKEISGEKQRSAEEEKTAEHSRDEQAENRKDSAGNNEIASGAGPDISVITAAFLILFGILMYFKSGYAEVAASIAAAFFVYVLFAGKPRYFKGEAHIKKINRFMFVSVLVFIAARTAAAVLMPVEYMLYEHREIIDVFREVFKDRSADVPVIEKGLLWIFLMVFKNSLAAVKAIPLIVYIAGGFAFYYAGMLLRDKSLGLSCLFVYIFFSWNSFMFRSLDEAVYIPVFIALIIILFMAYLNRKKPLFLAGAFFVITGVVSAHEHVYGIPVSLFFMYAAFEYRKTFTKKYFWMFMAAAAAAGLFSLYKILPVFSGPGRDEGFLTVLLSAGREYLETIIFPRTVFPATGDAMNLFHFTELIFLAAGIAVLAAGIRNKNKRIILAGFLTAVLSFLFAGNKTSAESFAFAAPFYIFAAAFGIDAAKKWKYAFIAFLCHVILSFYVFGFLALSSVSYTMPGKTEKQIAEYINKKYKEIPLIFIHETAPGNYYYAYIRSKAAYMNRRSPQRAAFIAPVYMRDTIKNIFPDASVRNVNYNAKQSLLPHAVYTVDFINDAQTAGFFIQMKKELEILAEKSLNGDYEGVYEEAKDCLVRGLRISEKEKLKNTFVMVYRIEAADFLGRITDVTADIEKNIYGMQKSSDLYYRLALACISYGADIRAQKYLLKAIERNPHWQAPRDAYKLTTGRM